MSETGLIVREAEALMPVMSIETATERYQTIVEYVGKLMKVDTDYGKIPGTDKNTLLKPGAEKLCTLFGLSKRFSLIERIEDWNGTQYGDPFFNYIYRCGLYRGEFLIAEADGSCNSRETKYRWRKAERTCPTCGNATIIKGREEYGGGWLCFAKKGGCGAKFHDNDEAITSQQTGRVPNPDIADQVNTIQKMAQKRALIAATLLAVNASEFFTQDMEDFTDAAPTKASQRALTPQEAAISELMAQAEKLLPPNSKKLTELRGISDPDELGRKVELLLQASAKKKAAAVEQQKEEEYEDVPF